jgi:uncharacterized repeat protein (TIGR01451 family)
MYPSFINSSPQPLGFQMNQGQTSSKIKFAIHLPGYHLLLTSSETIIGLTPSATTKRNTPLNSLALSLRGSHPNPPVIGLEELPGKINYFKGNTPSNWLTDIPTYGKVKYQNVYPGIDAIYSANQKNFKWDFILQPEANPTLIGITVSDNAQLILEEEGNLLLTMEGIEIRLHKPVVYQEDEKGKRKEIGASYQLTDNTIHFLLGPYDQHNLLVIDPIIEYSTYLGGTNDDYCYASALDDQGNLYMTGLTWSSWSSNPLGFPIKDRYQGENAGYFNAFITKLTPTGALVYSTYLGGNDGDNASGIAVDSMGFAYVTGSTFSPDFPTTSNAIQPKNNGSWDAFVTKLTPAGNNLVYSTCLGGSGDDMGYGIAVDPHGNAYITGYTESSAADPKPFPTHNPMQTDNNSVSGFGTKDAFVTKINTDGSLGYSTYLGGLADDMGYGITTDSTGNAYITGSTSSDQTTLPAKAFPITTGCYQPSFAGNMDVFITKLDPKGLLVYSTYLGGWSTDEGHGIAVDPLGNAYVTGFTASDHTFSPSFPTYKPLQENNKGNFDVFVTKLNNTGSALLYSTFLGGAGDDRGYGIAVDTTGYSYVTGYTSSQGNAPSGFPLKNPLQEDNHGGMDAFITKLKPDGSDFIYSTYLGGKQDDFGYSITADEDGTAYITGHTFSSWDTPLGPPGFPLKKPLQDQNNGATDLFALKLAPTVTLRITNSESPNVLPLGQNLVYKITISNDGPDPATKIMVRITLPPSVLFLSSSTGCKPIGDTLTCNLGTMDPSSQATITIIVKPTILETITTKAILSCKQTLPISLTLTTKVISPISYPTRIIKTDWRKHPPC